MLNVGTATEFIHPYSGHINMNGYERVTQECVIQQWIHGLTNKERKRAGYMAMDNNYQVLANLTLTPGESHDRLYDSDTPLMEKLVAHFDALKKEGFNIAQEGVRVVPLKVEAMYRTMAPITQHAPTYAPGKQIENFRGVLRFEFSGIAHVERFFQAMQMSGTESWRTMLVEIDYTSLKLVCMDGTVYNVDYSAA